MRTMHTAPRTKNSVISVMSVICHQLSTFIKRVLAVTPFMDAL